MKPHYFKLEEFTKEVSENIVLAKLEKSGQKLQKKKTKKFLRSLFKVKFQGLALDFDGTLIPIEQRTVSPDSDIIEILKELNKKKIPIFILTGRGSSIFKQFPFKDFENIEYFYVAQYNGGKILLGNEEVLFKFKIKELEQYQEIIKFLKHNNINYEEKLSSFVIREMKDDKKKVQQFFQNLDNWKVVNTGYSFDIIPINISKDNALNKGCNYFNIGNLNKVLKIGDSGDIDGNDYDFLRLRNSFSVGRFSPQLHTNFPILNSNNKFLKGPEGLKFILKNLQI